MSDLAKRIMKHYNQKGIGKIKNSKGQTLEQMLHKEALYLQELIKKHLNEYLDYHPEYYAFGTQNRTGNLQDSVSVEDVVKVQNGRLEICVFFDEQALHGSGFGAWNKTDGQDVNTAILLNYGYTVKADVWFKNIENFGWREPAHFVEDAIDEFNATNSLGITIDKTRDIVVGTR